MPTDRVNIVVIKQMKAYVVLMTSTDNEWNEITPSFSFSFFSTPSSRPFPHD